MIINIILAAIICWIIIILVLYSIVSHIGIKAGMLYAKSNYYKSMTPEKIAKLMDAIESGSSFVDDDTNIETVGMIIEMSDEDIERYHNNPKLFKDHMSKNFVFEADLIYHKLMHTAVLFDALSAVIYVMTLTVISMQRTIL